MGAVDRIIDGLVTLCCWAYFTLGFLLFFAPFYLAAALFSRRPDYLFQRLNRTFYRGFFALLRRLAPRQQWQLDSCISDIRSAVVVCNHLSYLDPLLMIALLNRAKTIVKPVFFAVPIFGWVLRRAGYFPAATSGPHAGLMIDQLATMASYLAEGGNIFIFPEGTRSRDGRLGALNPGALKIARACQAPLYVLGIANTDRLFTPGKFFFYSRRPNTIRVRILDRIDLEPGRPDLTAALERMRLSLGRAGEE